MVTHDLAANSSIVSFPNWWSSNRHWAKWTHVPVEVGYLKRGGAIVALREIPGEACFDSGKIHVTEAAIRAMTASGQYAWGFLLRHLRGDWGLYGRKEDVRITSVEREKGCLSSRIPAKQNTIAVLNHDGRVVSEFEMPNGIRLWIITHLEDGGYSAIMLSTDG